LELPELELKTIHSQVDGFRTKGEEGAKEFDLKLREEYTLYSEYNFKRKANPDDLDMQYNTNYLYSRYYEMKAYYEKKEKE